MVLIVEMIFFHPQSPAPVAIFALMRVQFGRVHVRT